MPGRIALWIHRSAGRQPQRAILRTFGKREWAPLKSETCGLETGSVLPPWQGGAERSDATRRYSGELRTLGFPKWEGYRFGVKALRPPNPPCQGGTQGSRPISIVFDRSFTRAKAIKSPARVAEQKTKAADKARTPQQKQGHHSQRCPRWARNQAGPKPDSPGSLKDTHHAAANPSPPGKHLSSCTDLGSDGTDHGAWHSRYVHAGGTGRAHQHRWCRTRRLRGVRRHGRQRRQPPLPRLAA